MTRARLTSLILGLVSAVLALVAAFAITSVVLLAAGDPVGEVWGQLLSWPESRNWANMSGRGSYWTLFSFAVALHSGSM